MVQKQKKKAPFWLDIFFNMILWEKIQMIEDFWQF